MEKFPRPADDDDLARDRYNPRRVDPELEAGEVFGVAADDVPQAVEPEPDEPIRKRKKKKRKPLLDAAGREIKEDRLLSRVDEPPVVAWWMLPAIFAGIGVIGILVPIVVQSLKVKSGAPTIAMMFALLALIVVIVQSAMVTTLLYFIGGFFGVDYGPAFQAIVRIVSVVVLADGLTMVFNLATPSGGNTQPSNFIFLVSTLCGAMVASLFAIGAFQILFKLSLQETLLSVGGIIGASWILNAVIVVILMSKAAARA